MHIHILGICGTFMGGLAALAREAGHQVTGCDSGVYPPMSDQLRALGIELVEGYGADQLGVNPDLFVVGNVVTRGNPLMEAVLNAGAAYISGPQWLAEHVLQGRHVLAVAGTHGKTTTTAMLAWILEQAGLQPGFLVGGVPLNFGVSARLGSGAPFVIEADEYDTAFFDKRSKFVHYRARTAVLNNLEFDHADIFPDLAAIQTQFHHLIRTVPASGRILWPAADAALAQVLERGCWSETETTGAGGRWQAQLHAAAGTDFAVTLDGAPLGEVKWTLTGAHNVANALAAIAAARHAGVTPAVACQALGGFRGVKRRLECLFDAGGIRVYDDFAHHPTAIATTLEGLRRQVGDETIVAILEPRSNTMKLGVHRDQLGAAVVCADRALWYRPAGLDWSLDAALAGAANSSVVDDIDVLLDQVAQVAAPAHLVIMSNGGFQGFQRRLVARLARRVGAAS